MDSNEQSKYAFSISIKDSVSYFFIFAISYFLVNLSNSYKNSLLDLGTQGTISANSMIFFTWICMFLHMIYWLLDELKNYRYLSFLKKWNLGIRLSSYVCAVSAFTQLLTIFAVFVDYYLLIIIKSKTSNLEITYVTKHLYENILYMLLLIFAASYIFKTIFTIYTVKDKKRPKTIENFPILLKSYIILRDFYFKTLNFFTYPYLRIPLLLVAIFLSGYSFLYFKNPIEITNCK